MFHTMTVYRLSFPFYSYTVYLFVFHLSPGYRLHFIPFLLLYILYSTYTGIYPQSLPPYPTEEYLSTATQQDKARAILYVNRENPQSR